MPDSNASKDNTQPEVEICPNKGPSVIHQHQHQPAENKDNWVHSFIINSAKMWRQSTKTVDRTLDELGAYEILDSIVQQLARHPFLAFGMSVCFLSMALPFIVFMIFAIATVIMTFTGFVIIEGTLITIASALLFGFLGAVILFFLFFGFVMLSGYFGLLQIYELLDYPNKRRAIYNYIRGLRSVDNN